MAQLILTFSLAVLSVSLWTLRVAVTARGNRTAGSGIAMVEALTFVTVYSQVVNSTDGPVSLIVYGLGVGLGTYLGVSMDRRIRALPQVRHSYLPSETATHENSSYAVFANTKEKR